MKTPLFWQNLLLKITINLKQSINCLHIVSISNYGWGKAGQLISPKNPIHRFSGSIYKQNRQFFT